MEDPQTDKYKVIITHPAEMNFYEILDYLYDNYPVDRAEEIANEIRNTAKSLHHHPERGASEPQLKHRTNDYRFILYQRTKRADIKIIYYLQENTVFITDFFPTEKDDSTISERNQ